MDSKSKFKINITHLLAFISGIILTAIINIKVDNYFSKPKIICSIECMDIYNNEFNEYVLNLYLQLENKGQRNSSFSFGDLYIKFKDINDRPYLFKIDKKIEISGYSYKKDTIVVELPSGIENISSIPKIENLILDFHEIKRKKKIFIKKDSTQVVWSFFQDLNVPVRLDSIKNDPNYVVKNGQLKIKMRNVPITYKDTTYICHLFPYDAYISYKVDNERIKVTYGHEIKFTEAKNGHLDLLLEPIVFIPAPEIKDKFILPNGFEFSMQYDVKEKDAIKIKKYSVKIRDTRDTKKQIVYFFK